MEKKFKLEKIDLLLCALGLLYIFMQIGNTPYIYEYGYYHSSGIGFFSTIWAMIVLAVPTVLAVLFRKKLPLLVIAGAAFFSISEHLIAIANHGTFAMIYHSLITPYAIIMYILIPAFVVAMIMSRNKAVMKIASLALLGMYVTFAFLGAIVDNFSYYCQYGSNVISWFNYLPYLICAISLASTAFSPDGTSEPTFKLPLTQDLSAFALHIIVAVMALGSLSSFILALRNSGALNILYTFFRQFILVMPFLAIFVLFRKNNIKLFILGALIITSLMEFLSLLNFKISIMNVLLYFSSLIYTAALILAMIKNQNKTFVAISGLVLIGYSFMESIMFSSIGSLLNDPNFFLAPNEFHVLTGIAFLEYAIFAPTAPNSYDFSSTTGNVPPANAPLNEEAPSFMTDY